jgi:hypothetical protein
LFIYLAGRNSTTSLTEASKDSLERFLSHAGLLTAEFSITDSLFVCLDIDRAALRFIRKHKVPQNQAILVRNEPKVVCPANYRPSYISKFGKVIEVGRPETGLSSATRWPQNWPNHLTKASEGLDQNRSKLVMVNADKLSFVKGEMYSLRRASMSSLPVDTFGIGWDNSFLKKSKILEGELLIALAGRILPHLPAARGWFSRPQNFQGKVIDKISTMEKYKHALIIENDCSFVSEKLFDALFAGCIPVYVGGDLKSLNMPPGLVFEADPSIDGLLKAFAKAKEVNFEEWSKLRDEYLAEPTTILNNTSPNVFHKIAALILD